MSSLEVLTLESFELWSTKALKSFLALRHKPTEGSFKELASRQVGKFISKDVNIYIFLCLNLDNKFTVDFLMLKCHFCMKYFSLTLNKVGLLTLYA